MHHTKAKIFVLVDITHSTTSHSEVLESLPLDPRLKSEFSFIPIVFNAMGVDSSIGFSRHTPKGDQGSRLDLALDLVRKSINNFEAIGLLVYLESKPTLSWRTAGRALSERYRRSPFPRTVVLKDIIARDTAEQLTKHAGAIFDESFSAQAIYRVTEDLKSKSYSCSACGTRLLYVKPMSLNEQMRCSKCSSSVSLPARAKINNDIILLNHDSEVMQYQLDDSSDMTVIGRVIAHPEKKNVWGLKNTSNRTWRFTKQDGTAGEVPASKSIVIQDLLLLEIDQHVIKIRAAQHAKNIMTIPPNSETVQPEPTKYVAHPTYAKYSSGCASCGDSIEGSYHVFKRAPGVKVCTVCVDRYQCDFCALPCDKDRYTYADGRISCAHCRGFAVTNLEELQELHDLARDYLTKELNLTLLASSTYRLVISSAAEIARELSKTFVPTDGFDAREVGFFWWQRCGKVKKPIAIYIEDGATRNQAYGTLVHELTHLWQITQYHSMSHKKWVEGFAQWTSHQALEECGATDELYGIEHHPSPYYGGGFHEVLKLENEKGQLNVADAVTSHVNKISATST